MGSRSTDLAYIAGFLDGDGSLMLQLKKRTDGRSGWRFMVTICFYQDSRHDKPLIWIRRLFGVGYLSKRNDGMSELRINGFRQVHDILVRLRPFIRFKRVQVSALIAATGMLMKKKLSQTNLRKLIDYILVIQNQNYIAKRKKSRNELLKIVGLTP